MSSTNEEIEQYAASRGLSAMMSSECWKVANVTGSISIKYKLLNDKAKPPCRAHPDDAGLDICITEDLDLPPGSRWPASTGLAF